MSFVIYDRNTTYIFVSKRTRKERWATYGAACAAMTRYKLDDKIWAIADANEFHNRIEKTKIVHSLMNGAPIELPVNTPRCCDPSSELYWSM